MRCRLKTDSTSVVSVMTFRELVRYGEHTGHAACGEFMFHGLRIDASRWFVHGDPMLVLYRDGVEVGQLGAHDRLIIEDDGAVYPMAHATFDATFERDPEWQGGPVGRHRRAGR